MGNDTRLGSAPSVGQRSFWDDLPSLEAASQGVADQLTRRAALTVVLALSLGLWAAIWTAVASLASALFG